MVLQKKDDNFVDCEVNDSSCAADGQMGSMGYVLSGRGLENNCLFGMMERRRARVRQRKKHMDRMKELIGSERMTEVLRLADDQSTIVELSSSPYFFVIFYKYAEL